MLLEWLVVNSFYRMCTAMLHTLTDLSRREGQHQHCKQRHPCARHLYAKKKACTHVLQLCCLVLRSIKHYSTSSEGTSLNTLAVMLWCSVFYSVLIVINGGNWKASDKQTVLVIDWYITALKLTDVLRRSITCTRSNQLSLFVARGFPHTWLQINRKLVS